MLRAKILLLSTLSILFLGFLIMQANFMGKTSGSQTAGLETMVVPSEPGERDIRLKLTIPSAFLHQRGETWRRPLSNVSFALDTRTDSATTLSPIEEPAVVVVILAITNYDMLEAQYNSDHPRSTGRMDWIWSRKIERRYGLNYVTNQIFPGLPVEEYLFDDGPRYRTSIECRPSGNVYPSLCTLTEIGERGGGKKVDSQAALKTDVVFRHERLHEWKSISDHVRTFMKDKLTVIREGN